MKWCLVYFPFLLVPNAMAQTPLLSEVYPWAEHTSNNTGREILAGSTTALETLNVKAHVLAPGEALDVPSSESEELLVIVKAGEINVTLNDETHILGRGGVAVVTPSHEAGLENAGEGNAACYVFRYRAKAPDKGKAGSPSFVVNWDTVAVNNTDKGARRSFFDRPTAAFERFEMHVTTLNEGLQSHPPHTHAAEEFILVMEGDVEEHIDGAEKKATAGDLIFLDSLVPHSIRNVGTGPATYFAFQWE